MRGHARARLGAVCPGPREGARQPLSTEVPPPFPAAEDGEGLVAVSGWLSVADFPRVLLVRDSWITAVRVNLSSRGTLHTEG